MKKISNKNNKIDCHPEERSELRILPVKKVIKNIGQILNTHNHRKSATINASE